MFLSCHYIKTVAGDNTIGKWVYQYKIIDTDFEEVDIRVNASFVAGFGIRSRVISAVIETYRKRNLPVAPNLFLSMQFRASQYSYWTIEKQIEFERERNPYWSEYEDEINKYLLLI